MISVSLALERSGLAECLPPGSLATVVYTTPRPAGQDQGSVDRYAAAAGPRESPPLPGASEGVWLEIADEALAREVLADLAARRSNSCRIP